MNILLFLPVTRQSRLDDIRKYIKQLDIPNDVQLQILVIVDNLAIPFWFARNAFFGCGYKYNIRFTQNYAPPEADIGFRRNRITEVFKMAQKYIPYQTDLIFTVEDDTELKPDTLKRLLQGYKNMETYGDKKIGVMSGVQAGRWGFRIIGAWLCDDPKNPTIVSSVDFSESEIINRVDAAGFYCFLVSKELFINADFKFNQFGPDVNFGFDLTAKGYTNYIDWSIKVGHVTEHQTIYPDKDCTNIKFQKFDEWKRISP